MVKLKSRHYIKKILILLWLCFTIKNYAKEQTVPDHIWEGNLALPSSQQPGALVALGQNIVAKDDLLLFVDYDSIKGKRKKNNTITTSLIYGINDISSLVIEIPIATKFKNNNQHSSGIGDITVQYERAYFTKNYFSYGFQGTVLGNIGLPTGSAKKNPSTGFGSPSFFLGTTITYLSVEWYGFLSAGATLTTSRHGNKHGNQYFYQGGFGKNIAYRSKKWLLTGLVEFDGTYEQSDKRKNVTNINSGGNVILNNYSLWFSTKRLIAIAGISVPIAQHLFGKQNKTNFAFELVVGWKI